ncbi:MAG TPA: adenylate/guanylate cyclase domain-containing protein [Actinomycetota bacterium]|nr:adenylate/guanylate cyclase domain-containing protein [Actinomycetota bacterium]
MLTAMECDFCGQPLPEGARFCPNCGTPLSTTLGTEERKMVTVLFADLVDSTGLAQRLDPERAREVLGGFFDAASEELRALRGHPEKFIGDAVMAVFGLPHVSEDDAVRAVRAGLAIRDRMHRLQQSLGLDEPLEVRVGVETGEAATGVGPTGQLLVTGQVVNASARLQTAAQPGEVLIGATTHALTKDAVSFGEKREVEAKGFATALPAYPVEALTTRSARRTIPFVGRANELDILRGSVARVNATSSPLLVSILGEPGVGKSRLADELIASLGSDVTVLRGRAEAYGDTATFAPVTAIVRDIAGIEDEMAPEEAMRRLQEVVEGCCDPSEAERIAGRLGLTIGLGAPKREESVFVQDVQSGFLSLIEGLSGRGPVVLVFEDVHGLRQPMLDLIERVVTSARDTPQRTLTIALGRPELLEERPAWGSGVVNAVTLRLDPLPGPEAVELVREAAGGHVGDAEAIEIADRTGGNPFFIVETTGMVLRARQDGAASSGRALPPTVQAVVASRLDSLRHRLRDLARRASVFIYSFDLEELSTVSDADADDIRGLEEAEILVREDGGRASRWRYRHETVREVAYASLPKRERLSLHERIADALMESGHRSYAADHLELAAQASMDMDPADRRVPDRAVDALIMAGDRARRRMESRSAVEYYERALAMAGPEGSWGAREGRALAGTGESHYWLGEYPTASQALARAVELGEKYDDAWTLTLALRYQGDIAINVDRDLDKAEQLLADSLAAAGELDDAWAMARSLLFAGWVPWTRDDLEEAGAIWHRALTLADEHDDTWARVRALTALSINSAQQNNLEEASALIEQARELAEEMGDRFSVAVTMVQRGRLDEDRGNLEDAIPRFDRAIEIFKELGARWEVADALAERGICYRDLGRLDEGEEDLKSAIRISGELGEQQIAGWGGRALDRLAQIRAEGAQEHVSGG